MKDEYFKRFKEKGYFEKFDKKYFDEFEKELEEVIIPLLNNWNDLNEKELEILLKKFGKICRDETSLLRKELLSNDSLASVLLKIVAKYNDNTKIIIEIVSSINNMYARYNLKITNDIFNALLELTNNKKVNFYVSIFITKLPQFQILESKWDYILSIPKIAPRKKSINTFYRVINDTINNIPNEHRENIVKVFRLFLDNNSLHESTVEKYSIIIEKLDNGSN